MQLPKSCLNYASTLLLVTSHRHDGGTADHVNWVTTILIRSFVHYLKTLFVDMYMGLFSHYPEVYPSIDLELQNPFSSSDTQSGGKKLGVE